MRASCVAAVVLNLLFAYPALASPWTLPRGELALVTGLSFQSARREYLDEGGPRPFPLAGRYAATDLLVNARFGLTDDWELELGLPFRHVSYVADSVILLSTDATNSVETIDYFQENTLNFSRVATGIGDLRVAVRRRLFKGPLPAALELRLKTPTGYDPPSGTFGDRPKSAEDFVERAGELVRPENISDDVTLGSGQPDLLAQLLLGYSAQTGTFVRLDAGFNLRFDGAGDQVVGSLKAGQLIARTVLVYAGVDVAYSVQEGDVIGISVAAQDPRLPANEYGVSDGMLDPFKNLQLREVTLDYDALQFHGGVILRVVEGAEINVGYSRTLWGRNTALFNSLYVGVGTRFSTLESDAD